MALRPYRCVLLSDHGHSHGATFRQRYGYTLAELVQTLVAEHDRVAPAKTGPGAIAHTNALLIEIMHIDRFVSRPSGRHLQRSTRDGRVNIGSEAHAEPIGR